MFLGYLDRRNALLIAIAPGTFVFASRTETQGLVLLESSHVPMNRGHGTRDILEPGRGALVPPEDEEEVAASGVEVLRDPALRARLSREARACAAQWSAAGMAVRMAELYADVLGSAGRRAPAAAGLGKTALL
jgi:glycosyltransferase involved in cell wall biosynthesis